MVVEKEVGVPTAFTFASKALPKATPKRRAFVRKSLNKANDRGHNQNYAEQITHGSTSEFGKKPVRLKARHASVSLSYIGRRPSTSTVFFPAIERLLGSGQLPHLAVADPQDKLPRKQGARCVGERVVWLRPAFFWLPQGLSESEARGNVTLLIRVVCSIIAAEGFEPNHDKTAIMRRGGRQVVTGLVVNDVPKVSRRDTRRFRAIAHKCRTDGYVVVSESLGCDARSYLKGYLSFVSMVNEVQALRLERLCPPGLFDM